MRLRWGGSARGNLVAVAAALAVSGATADTVAGGTAVRPLAAASSPFGAAGASLTPTRARAGTCVARANWGIRRDDLAHDVARIVNRFRQSRGLHPLQLEQGLMRSAIWKAQHMAHFFYFGHSDPAPPVNRGVPQRLAACGFGSSGSENIAYGFDSPRDVVRAWLRSPGHRRNIVSASWRYLGVGVAMSHHGGTFWAQNFG